MKYNCAANDNQYSLVIAQIVLFLTFKNTIQFQHVKNK